MTEQDWSAFACANPDCTAYGQKGLSNLRPHGWSSKARNLRCLRCTTCGHHFSQRAGTPLFGTHLPQERAVQIAQHLAEGNGMRATARLCGVKGHVVRVEQRVVLGTEEQVAEALERGTTSESVNTSYVERYHGTQRHFNARKARKVYTFSKELGFHVAVTWLCVAFYNFGWTPRTLRVRVRSRPRRYRYRTPAMVAGLTDRRWSMTDILTHPLFPSNQRPGGPQQRDCDTENPEGG